MKNFIVNFSRLKLLLLLAFIGLTCAITIAEIGAEPAVEPTIEPSVEPAVEPTIEPSAEPAAEPGEVAISSLKERMQKRISVEFRNTAIEDALMLMADQADVDIVKSPTVTGSVTVKLTDVPLKEALDNILAAHGYRYVADKNMIRVASADEITQVAERILSRIYRITYADVKEVESALRKFLSKQGSLTSVRGTSNIIVTDTESQVKAMDEFISEIDRITPQILVEARIYDVTSTEGFDIGAEWEAGRNTDVTDITRENTHTRTDTADSGENYYEREQVWDAVTSTYTTDETTWNYEDPTTSYATTDTDTITKESTGRRSKPFVTGTFDKETGGTITFGLLNDAVDIELALNILHTQVSAKLLANPRILVLDNETAEFKIVSEIPYTEQSSTSSGGSMTSTRFKNVGVELTVTPHVTRDGMVRLDITPVFSVVSELGEILIGGRAVPTVDKREVDTKALVKDGQTVVIGGLRKREVSQDIRKIPVLGDMPLLGGLFRDESESIETSELLIFITPRIIVEPTLSPREQKQLRDTEFPTPKKPRLRLD